MADSYERRCIDELIARFENAMTGGSESLTDVNGLGARKLNGVFRDPQGGDELEAPPFAVFQTHLEDSGDYLNLRQFSKHKPLVIGIWDSCDVEKDALADSLVADIVRIASRRTDGIEDLSLNGLAVLLKFIHGRKRISKANGDFVGAECRFDIQYRHAVGNPRSLL